VKSLNVLALLVAIIASLQGGTSAYEIVGDLSTLQDQYRSFITEFESEHTAYDTSITRLLEKLDLLQYSSSHPNITLDWFTPPKDIPLHPPLRIFIVVSSFEGMYLNSGIGTFYSALSDFLVQRGHTVTIVYADTSASDTPAFTRWKAQAEKRGLRATRLGAFPIHLRLSTLAQRSYQVFEFLKTRQQEFDVVHVPDWEGLGYYSMLAKQDGIAFLSKLFIVGIHGPWRWVKAANSPNGLSSALTSSDDMETDWMERKSVEMGDMVWSPSSDIVTWLGQNGWAFPSSTTYKMPYLPGREVSQVKSNGKDTKEFYDNINEIVFFGRLETRKGLELFADALDRLAVTRPEFAGTKITFLGRAANIGNQSATAYIDNRFVKGAWPFKIVYVSHKDRKAALEYLSEPTRIAVIPSIVDNTPYTVYECLFSNIPFIASDIPSIASLVDAEDRDDVLFEVDAISLASKLENVLDNGAKTVKSAFQLRDIELSWRAFYANAYEMITAQKAALKKEKEESGNSKKFTPLVSVCITHFNRPQFLQLALESVEAQSYTNYEVVLVDDGSTFQDAKDYLETLVPKFNTKGWQLILSTNQYLGAARNKAAQHARGEYILFLDDDNLITPQLLRTYVDVAAHTHADIFTAAHDVFEGNGKAEEGTVVGRWVPLGASPSLGIFKNCFGDANFFIKKSVFVSQKGFTEDKGVGQEDHEFLAQAVLDGRSLVVIPEPLLAYRMHNQSEQMLYTTDSLKNALRAHRPYRSLMEDSGIEITDKGATINPTKSPESLKLLAYSRVHSRQATSTCNLTVTAVSPTQIPALTPSKLVFTTAARDCDIQTIRIGSSYSCTLGTVSTSSFTCTTQAIPVNGNYPIYIQLAPEVAFRDSGTRITVVPTPNQNGDTMVVITLSVYITAGQFNANQLLGLLAAAVKQSVSEFFMVSDMFTTVSKRDVSSTDELHTSTITITSGNPPAATVYADLFSVLQSNASCILPYRFYTISLNAACTASGECSCGPSYTGVGCTTVANCPNGCSGNGNCTTGEYTVECQCNPGWTGSDCSVGLCGNCNNGSCVVTAGTGNGTCVCDTGYRGTNCEFPFCPANCSGNPCTAAGVCICPPGVTTIDCSVENDNLEVVSNPPPDNYYRNVFIGVLVAFTGLGSAAVGLAYHTYQQKALQPPDDE
jgi:glycosyltransferase involved in cell wall biosynthesis